MLLATKQCSSLNFHDHTMCLFETPFSRPSPALPESIARGLLFLRPTHTRAPFPPCLLIGGFLSNRGLPGRMPTLCMPWPWFRLQRIRTSCCLKSVCTDEADDVKVDPLCNQSAGPRHSCHGRGHPPIPPRPLSQEPSRASVLLMLNPDVLVRKPTQAAEQLLSLIALLLKRGASVEDWRGADRPRDQLEQMLTQVPVHPKNIAKGSRQTRCNASCFVENRKLPFCAVHSFVVYAVVEKTFYKNHVRVKSPGVTCQETGQKGRRL